ncbi:hypothetical protein BpHYR1_012308 [Brachionus plicatilis]|uniref:Uncharacterized protein n=1 Tax=Brachionus plicatilis TaxID=10195 RepID=A0A3M7R770_BRAPC|nr:hypothetical protein BpHYR1_012308 [Brachionus plicatilis]
MKSKVIVFLCHLQISDVIIYQKNAIVLDWDLSCLIKVAAAKVQMQLFAVCVGLESVHHVTDQLLLWRISNYTSVYIGAFEQLGQQVSETGPHKLGKLFSRVGPLAARVDADQSAVEVERDQPDSHGAQQRHRVHHQTGLVEAHLRARLQLICAPIIENIERESECVEWCVEAISIRKFLMEFLIRSADLILGSLVILLQVQALLIIVNTKEEIFAKIERKILIYGKSIALDNPRLNRSFEAVKYNYEPELKSFG